MMKEGEDSMDEVDFSGTVSHLTDRSYSMSRNQTIGARGFSSEE